MVLNSEKQAKGNSVSGLTLVDFVSLPAKARICFIYEGDAKTEAFYDPDMLNTIHEWIKEYWEKHFSEVNPVEEDH